MNWTDFFIGFMFGFGSIYWILKLLILPYAIDKFVRDSAGKTFEEEYSDGSVYHISVKKKRYNDSRRSGRHIRK